MKPHVTLHMSSTIDGQIITRDWPKALSERNSEIYEDIHRKLKGDAWIVGRTTMAEFADGEAKPMAAREVYPRTTWKTPVAVQGPYAVGLDRAGKLHLNKDRANGDPIIAVLTESVPDDHLAELRRDGISYLFAGSAEIDLTLALDVLNEQFGVRRLLLEGGGGINGSFLDEGLIDEISLLIVPLADGRNEMASTIDGVTKAIKRLALISVERLEADLVHLRYALS